MIINDFKGTNIAYEKKKELIYIHFYKTQENSCIKTREMKIAKSSAAIKIEYCGKE
jgi:hypothetical protein